MKIAVLSNININGTIRILKRDTDVFEAEGYGNEIGMLLNPNSGIYEYSPDQIFIIEDLQELTGHSLNPEVVAQNVKQWFLDVESSMKPEIIYYISDAFCYGVELQVLVDAGLKEEIEGIWLSYLKKLIARNHNVRIFPYRSLVEKLGVDASFSMKMWYMGKMLHSLAMQQLLAKTILEKSLLENNVPKKALLLDLDNTLWGGLAGEDDITPIILSEEHAGLAYKNLQRVILEIKKQGVILGVVSKNQERDALHIINEHPHMVLRDQDFAIKKISWDSKDKSLTEIADELKIGLDSMVFFDDNPAERQLIKEMLPQVTVPDFPDSPEGLAEEMIRIWKRYFDRPVITAEDTKKTEQYAANAKREKLKKASGSFENYLLRLNIVLTRKKSVEHIERVVQLLNKTNQFNLTMQRHTLGDIQEKLTRKKYKVFCYQAADRFGDNGIIAVAIVNLQDSVPVIEEFAMSCRMMGKNIENAIIDDIEEYLLNNGYSVIEARYVQNSKNTPVSELYDSLGYHCVGMNHAGKKYKMILAERPRRTYQLKKIVEEGE